MRKFHFFLIITLAVCSVKGQQFAVLKGTIISNDSLKIVVYKPVNGYFNCVFYPSENNPIISKTTNNVIFFQDSVQVDTSCFVEVSFTTKISDFPKIIDILVFPNDTVEFQYNTKDSTLKFTGNNAKGHELFNSITCEPARISIPTDDIINKFPNNRNTFIKELVNYGNTLSHPFEKLLNQKLITSQFYQTVNLNLHLWPVKMAANTLLFKNRRGEITPQQTIDSAVESIYSIYPPTSKSNSLLNTFIYYNDFLTFQAYKSRHFVSPKVFYSTDSVIFSQNSKQIKLDKEFVPFLYIEDPNIRQNVWGFMLTALLHYAPGVFSKNTIEEYEELNPTNNWSKILGRQYAAIMPEKIVSYTLTSPIVVIPNSLNISTFSELVKLLPKSDFHFVDIWSSWCGPCVRAFLENDYIDSVLQINHVTKLYVSIDKNKEAWLKAVNKYALGGYQVLANESLIIDMKEMLSIGINSNFTIPKYLLLNDKGEFVKELYSPVTRSKLAEQIKDLILKNK